MRAARGGCLLLLCCCSLLLPTAHDDEIEKDLFGKIAGASCAQSHDFSMGRYASNRRRQPLSLRLFASVLQTECRRFLRDKSVAYPVFSSMAGQACGAGSMSGAPPGQHNI
jgi:hypothetical protein